MTGDERDTNSHRESSGLILGLECKTMKKFHGYVQKKKNIGRSCTINLMKYLETSVHDDNQSGEEISNLYNLNPQRKISSLKGKIG